jgi:hypothetical protein
VKKEFNDVELDRMGVEEKDNNLMTSSKRAFGGFPL